MRDIRPDTDHIRLQLLQKAQIGDQVIGYLIRRADHEARAHLIADLFEIEEASAAVLGAHIIGVQHSVMSRVGGLVPQQIAVRSDFKIPLIALARLLAYREGDRAVGVFASYSRYDITYDIIGIIRILTTL